MYIDGLSLRHGYYRVGNYVTMSKIDAFLQSEKMGILPTWLFNDEVYGKCDWKIEPTESIGELYKKRALQLREKHQHLTLLYSGGSDSTNILRAFEYNKIPLDEICIFHWGELLQNKGKSNKEIFKSAVPIAKKYIENHQNTKLTIKEISNTVHSFFTEKESVDWFWRYRGMYMPSKALDTRPDLFFKDKETTYITGFDKPRVYVDNYGFHYFSFIDSHDFHHNSELFYWSPDLPDLVIKQSHIIMRVMKHLKVNSLKKSEIHRAIYPYQKDEELWIEPKNLTAKFTGPNIDVNIFYKSGEAAKRWKKSITYVWDNVPNIFKQDPNKMDSGLKVLNTRRYYLE